MVLAATLPLLLLVGLAVPLGVAWGLSRLGPEAGDQPSPSVGGAADAGRPGVGDPYYPDAGSSGYDAIRYAIQVSWDPGAEVLTGTTVISARASQPLRSFYVDLALTPERVSVDGAPAAFERQGFQDVLVTPAQPVAEGADFAVTVGYAGRPGRLRNGDTTPWHATGQEWTVAGEPESSAWWFPANDHPSDPALMDVSVRVPAGMEAVSVGRLASRDTGAEADFDTWHWVAAEPMATYLTTLSIGQFVLQEGLADGRPYVYAVSEQLPAAERDRAFAALQTSSQVVGTLESMFGPYPFSELGGIVPAHQLWFDGLESQTRPVYDRRSITAGDPSGLIAHELAHMWFGDNVTLRRWDDIFDNEAYASWAQWGYAERTGGRSAGDAFSALFARVRDRPAFWRVTMIDPGREHLFDVVYTRGPLVLQALRQLVGDETFFALARDWSHERGSRSLEEWMVEAQSRTSLDLVPFFQAWIYAPAVPEETAALGFRR